MSNPVVPTPVKPEGKLEKNSKVASIVLIAVTIVEKFSSFKIQLNSNVLLMLCIFCVFSVCVWLFSRNSRDTVVSSPDDDDIDVAAIIQRLTPPPHFHTYTTDDIDGLRWMWKWVPEATEPRPEFIDPLDCFCPKCGLRIEPRDYLRPKHLPLNKSRPTIFGSRTPASLTSFDAFAQFACEGACFAPITRNADLKSELGRIRRVIEQRAKPSIKEKLS